MNRFSIYCTEEQTRKALEIDAPIPHHAISLKYIEPTAEQMIGYLRMKGFKFSFDDTYNYWAVSVDCKIIDKGQSEDKELSAIDATLEYLTNNKK